MSDARSNHEIPEIGPAQHAARPLTRFQKLILGMATLLHMPWALAVAALGAHATNWPVAAICTLFLVAVSIWLFWGLARWIMDDAPRAALRVALLDMPYFVHLAGLVLGFVPALIALAFVALGRASATAVAWVYLGSYVMGLYGVCVRRSVFVVRELDAPIAALAPELSGLRMVHLSDLHIGGLMQRRQAMRWIRAANAAKPDLIVLTGDYVTSGVAFHADIAELLGALEAPLGVYASLGNHDYFGGGEPMITLLRERGVKVLRNQGEVIRRGSGMLYLAGVDDAWTRRADVELTLSGWQRHMPCVLLAHDPDLFVQAAAQGVSLTLSGHTHGGQIAVPFLARWLSLSHLAHRYHQGFYQRGESRLYVSPGLGTTGLPLRLGTVPTIAVHVLRLAPASAG